VMRADGRRRDQEVRALLEAVLKKLGGGSLMRRRHFAAGLLLTLVAPLTAEAQQTGKYRIGYLSIAAEEHITHMLKSLEEALQERGYTAGRNVLFERRFADGRPDRLPELAADLVRLHVNVIVTYGATATRAAKNATTAIPIVMLVHPDPVAAGLIASFALPGGNVTGLARLSQELSAKRLALLKDAVPTITRAAILWYPGSRDGEQSVKETEVAARTLGVQVQVMGIRDPSELESAFNSIKDAHGLIAVPSTVFFDSRAEIARLALKHRLPAIFPEKEFVDAGGLMAYGANLSAEFRRAATYVDKILKGATPAALPVEQPTNFELVINLKTAKALRLTIPPSVLARADQVIE